MIIEEYVKAACIESFVELCCHPARLETPVTYEETPPFAEKTKALQNTGREPLKIVPAVSDRDPVKMGDLGRNQHSERGRVYDHGDDQ